MGGRARAVLILALAGGCTPHDPVERLLLAHTVPGEVLEGGTAAQRAAAGLVEGPDGWVLSADEPAAWGPIGRAGEVALWRSAEPAVVLDRVPEGYAPVDDVVVGLRSRRGPRDAVLDLVLRPPMRAPLDLCLAVAGVDLPLAGAGLRVPGDPDQPLLGQRVWIDGSPETVGLRVTDCQTGSALHEVELVLPPVAELPDEALRPSRVASTVHLGVDVEPVDVALHGGHIRSAPPLPRLRVGDAWPVVVLGAVDPTGGDPEARPLRPLAGLLGPYPSVVAFDAPASRVGPMEGSRRATPELLRWVTEAGVDGVVLGTSHRDDAGVAGAARTEAVARALGLRTAGGPEHLALYLPTGGPVLAVLSPGVGEAPTSAQVQDARRRAGVVLAALDPGRRDPEPLAAEAVASGVDGAWLLGEASPWIDVVDGVPVVAGIAPSVRMVRGRPAASLATRWYLDERGVARLDVVPLQVGEGGTRRDRAARGALLRLAAASAARGAHVRVGTQVAVVDVAGHWPRALRSPPVLSPPAAPETVGLPPAELPARCRGEGAVAGELLAPGVRLEAHVLTPEVPAGGEVELLLRWEALGPELGAAWVDWTVSGPAGTTRGRWTPCQGSWTTDRFVPGQVVDDRVRLPVPDAPGLATVTGVVRTSDAAWTDTAGSREISLGEILVTAVAPLVRAPGAEP